MTITNDWTGWIGEWSKTRTVIAVEMQGHGHTADISMGGGFAMQVAIRHPERVRKVVSVSAVFRHDGWVHGRARQQPRLRQSTCA